MSELLTFLRARLDEDEATAGLVSRTVYACDGHGRRWDCLAQSDEKWADGTDRLPNHHATWTPLYDPARVLAEVAAKRAWITLALDHAETVDGEWGCGHTAADLERGYRTYPDQDDHEPLPAGCHAVDEARRYLAPLAAVYRDHEHYREEWKP